MEPRFWHERWQNDEIGFHQDEVNPYLQQFWERLQLKPGQQVFVPLCGKTRDMLWLRERGFRILGVELSAIAAQAFFDEHEIAHTVSRAGSFVIYQSEGIEIHCGDFFDTTATQLSQVSAVYDRASLIALPEELRARYVAHMTGVIPSGVPVLLVTLDYPQAEMTGPPFAVGDAGVADLFTPPRRVTKLLQSSILQQNPRFQARGLTRLEERVYLID